MSTPKPAVAGRSEAESVDTDEHRTTIFIDGVVRVACIQPGFLDHTLDGAVIIAVTTVGMMQMAVHQIVDVIGVRHGLMSAARPVHMAALMRAT